MWRYPPSHEHVLVIQEGCEPPALDSQHHQRRAGGFFALLSLCSGQTLLRLLFPLSGAFGLSLVPCEEVASERRAGESVEPLQQSFSSPRGRMKRLRCFQAPPGRRKEKRNQHRRLVGSILTRLSRPRTGPDCTWARSFQLHLHIWGGGGDCFSFRCFSLERSRGGGSVKKRRSSRSEGG